GYEGRVARTNVDDVALDLHRRGSRNVDDETGDVLVRTENGPGWLGELEHADKNRPRRKGSQATLDDAARIRQRSDRRSQQTDRERDRNSWSTTPTLDDHEVERDEHGLAEQEQRPSHWTGFAGCAEDSVQHARRRCDREAERRG